ncbi:hypothetical protein Tco_0830865 [Tanacetum coccineum]
MSTLKFSETHNLVAFLDKPKESEGFEQIIDFLNASSIRYVLTIQALVDKKRVIITEKSVRIVLMLEDAKGTECLTNDVIFEQLTLMGLQEKVLDLEEAKTAQAKEIASLKKRKEIIEEDVVMMNKDDLRGEEVVAEKEVAEKEVSVADPITTVGEVVTIANIDELTLAQTLIEIKTPKPKAITIAATTTTTTRPKAKGVAKDKGKAIMVEPKKYLKKKDQIALDEEVARNLEAQLQAEFEEERLARSIDRKSTISP